MLDVLNSCGREPVAFDFQALLHDADKNKDGFGESELRIIYQMIGWWV